MIGWMNEIIFKKKMKKINNREKNAVHVIFISYLMNEKKNPIYILEMKKKKQNNILHQTVI